MLYTSYILTDLTIVIYHQLLFFTSLFLLTVTGQVGIAVFWHPLLITKKLSQVITSTTSTKKLHGFQNAIWRLSSKIDK